MTEQKTSAPTPEQVFQYTLHTRAEPEQMRELVLMVACKTGEPALLEVSPDAPETILPARAPLRQPWSRRRLIVGVALNAIAAFGFYVAPTAVTGVTGYLIGWVIACLVLLW